MTAISFIAPNSAPPAGTETPVTGQVVLMQAGFRGMHVRTKVKQLCTGFIFKKLKTFASGLGPQDYKIRSPAARRRCYFNDQSLNNDPKLFPGLKVKLRA